jgi:hypothetical protein
MASYDDTLNFLRNLLTTKQTNQNSQFGQGMDFNRSVLGERGRQFDATTALQKALQDWQKNLQQQEFTAGQNQQGFLNSQLVGDKNFSRSPAGMTLDTFLASLGKPPAPAPVNPQVAATGNGYIDTFGKWHAGYA